MNNNDLAYAVFEAMNSRDFSRLEKNMSDDLVIDFPGAGRVSGRRRSLILLKALLHKYPKLVFTVKEVFGEENRACAVWSNKGENTAGEPYQNEGITLFHFVKGNVVFISDYFKDTSFTQSS